MSKEEIIKKAYGNYDFAQDKNGWCLYDHLPEDTDLNLFDLKNKIEDGVPITLARHKILKGIENNNGWIKIESEDDLPESINDYWVIRKNETEPLLCRWSNVNVEFHSHYQPIVKPNLPIY